MAFRFTSEIGAALAAFYHGGKGPFHSDITNVARSAGYADADPGTDVTKVERIRALSAAVLRTPRNAHNFTEQLLNTFRLKGIFETENSNDYGTDIRNLRNALQHVGYDLTPDGRLTTLGEIDLETGGREAINEQLNRLRRSLDDPAALIGTTKDLLESVSKFVLEENGRLPEQKLDFPAYFAQATELLKMKPKDIDTSNPGGKQARDIMQAVQSVALKLNELRNAEGTGHGRTLPSGITTDTARFVIRTGSHVAELMLATHDRMMNRI